ncbi:enoyl-CoA hydratase/isomerase family protein [Erythrobacter sp. EC-HK427]|uniref:enoyl-CoA hydratase/isomerase family protein n=1 Tax=Erythrobacter sp. EC-HK427 TaxID=2038396 RepID=UPI001255022C|nr:enoyl-CoA hydratase/isomerase family protein [Erythrobacter sp. EC-HK427]VVT10565.1 Enoyl-CoA hydratase [Erythrobacter sp. EC-HK427]
MSNCERIGDFELEVLPSGVAVATFSRPPVNAFSLAVYEALGKLTDRIAADDAIKALVMRAPEEARAWCGGADLKDFEGITKTQREERYAFINRQLPKFHALDRPTIAAIAKPAVGIGMVLSSLFDFRVAAREAKFALPEVDFGLLSGCAGRFVALRLPEPKLREMLYTGRKYTAAELQPTGFFNYVVDADDVLPRAMALAEEVAAKDSAIMRARKHDSLKLEGDAWFEAYLAAQQGSAAMVENDASRAGVAAALHRKG